MAPGLNQNAIALQIEAVRPEVPLLYQLDDTLLKLIQKKAKGLQTVSSRAYRAPVEITAGGAINQFNPDGGNLGRGSALKTDVLLINQFYFNFAVEYTALAEIATDDKEKAVENYVTRQMTRMMEQFRAGIEALLAYGDSSGTLDTVVRCTGCGHEVRYNFDTEPSSPTNETYDEFVAWACRDAEESCVCECVGND